MIRFLGKRLMWMIITMWVVFTVSFFLMWTVSPEGALLSERQLPEAIKRNLEEYYDLDKPLGVRYVKTMTNYAQLDPGPSMKLIDKSVLDILKEGLPISISLGLLGLCFAMLIGFSTGIVSALRRQSLIDVTFRMIATLGIAIPNFVLAGFAIIILVFGLNLFPAAGWGRPIDLVLPSLCLAAPFAAYISRLTRTGMLEVLGQDYIRTAYAKGLMPATVVMKHAFRGAILPVVSYLGPATAGILTGSLVLERIFFIPGLGSHFIEAVQQKDHPVSLAVVMIYTFLLFSMNTLVDLSYGLIDPRVKLDK
ncbi:ABC transporter permease [Bremerella cremea]|uniref:ABC transporter n=1 Tax=Blastopirellula marina TaxID=124 RepID=A0A2S8FAZ9_9BACT|nr:MULTISPECIES: ABC transporter permease [Pirellulaceae]PQO29348.1 ABC transporter [Blastopirellula marina]RCS42652.1 ABC transporter permease [Bremerella cremea]